MNTGLDARSFLYRGENMADIATERLESLGGFGVVLNIPGNRYMTGAESYLSDFITASEGSYSNKIRDVLAQNIQTNQSIIDTQKSIWQKIEQDLAAQGMTLKSLLQQKVSSKNSNVYTEESLKQEFADIANLADMQKKINSKLSTQIQETESSYRNVLRKISGIVGTYDRTNLPEIIEQLKSLEGSFTNELEDTYYKRLIALTQTDEVSETLIAKLQQMDLAINGRQLTLKEENGQYVFDDPQNFLKGNVALSQELTSLVSQMMNARKSLQGTVSRRQKTQINKGTATAKDFDPSRYLATSPAQLARMKSDNGGKNDQIKAYVSAYHKLITALENEYKRQLAKNGEENKNSFAYQSIQKSVAALAKGKSTTLSLATNQNFYSLSGEAFELLGADMAETIGKNVTPTEEEAIAAANDKHPTRLYTIHVGNQANRSVIKTAGAILPGSIQTQISQLGNITKSLIDDVQYYKHPNDADRKAQIAQVMGKIDSVMGVKGSKYKIAFSDKLYNLSNARNYSIAQGNLLSNFISLDNGSASMNNQALYLLLLNLSNIASFYSETKREKAKKVIQNLLSQNFFALAFDPSNAEFNVDLSAKDTLYISNFSGQMVPLYTVLETINNYMQQILDGNENLAKNPVKANIQYANMSMSPEAMYQDSLYAIPYLSGVDARWRYVASQVAAQTKTQVEFDIMAFGNMYASLFNF